jgi:hypothetical protein
MQESHVLSEEENFLSQSKIIICSIVRNCGKSLSHNIHVINDLCDLANDYQVIIFENDSKDNTKSVLKKWSEERENIYINSKDLNVGNTIPNQKKSSVNPFYSKIRIDKMAMYRNQYMEYIDKMNIIGDFLIVVDLDVINIELDGIIDSFRLKRDWDAISANGISMSPRLTRRYHDSYALVEVGFENIPQTEESIKRSQYRFSFLRKGLPLFKVFSAYGGLVIYRFEAVKGLRYSVLSNNDKRVEVRCEHFGFHHQMQQRGFDKIFINPNMEIKYQKFSFTLVYKTILARLSSYLQGNNRR